jgi:hypothetical protein
MQYEAVKVMKARMEVGHRAPYLLDTSALRALLGKILEEHTFYTSPYCFWELLTHLDEGQVTRTKGQLMKLRFTHILDDPRAAIETPLLVHDAQLQDRVSDEELNYSSSYCAPRLRFA